MLSPINVTFIRVYWCGIAACYLDGFLKYDFMYIHVYMSSLERSIMNLVPSIDSCFEYLWLSVTVISGSSIIALYLSTDSMMRIIMWTHCQLVMESINYFTTESSRGMRYVKFFFHSFLYFNSIFLVYLFFGLGIFRAFILLTVS